MEGHLEVIKYLTSSHELKEHIDINKKMDKYFEDALSCNQSDVIRYFIFDLNIEKNKKIEKLFQQYPNPQFESWFNLRDVNKELAQELDGNKPNNKKNKI
jgi:hypothetical protein